ncbi:MAG: S24/S26 family peptidase, partial [Candidatus Acidiferrum sp.]
MRKSSPIVIKNSAQFGDVCAALLQQGAKVRFRANGLSMQPNILNNDAVIVAPIEANELRRGDVALTHGADGFRAHRVSSVSAADGVATRADASQEGDAATDLVLGKVIAIERNGRRHSLAFPGQEYLHA